MRKLMMMYDINDFGNYFKFSKIIDNETINIIEYEIFNYIAQQNYLERVFFKNSNNEDELINNHINTLDGLKYLWDRFISMYGENIYRSYIAMYSEYNPIDNYDRYETIQYGATDSTDTFGNTFQTNVIGTDTTTQVFGKNEKVEELDIDKVTESRGARANTSINGATNEISSHYENSMEDNVYHSDGKDVTTTDIVNNSENFGSYTDTITTDSKTNSYINNEHTDTITNSGKTDTISIDSHIDRHQNNSHTDNIHAHGNIGVTKTQTMINDELNLRLKDLQKIYIDLFFYENTFYLER